MRKLKPGPSSSSSPESLSSSLSSSSTAVGFVGGGTGDAVELEASEGMVAGVGAEVVDALVGCSDIL